MVKEHKEKEKVKEVGERRVLLGLIWNCAAELKLILTALLLLCSFATLLQFLPPSFFPLYYYPPPSNLPSCLTTPIASATATAFAVAEPDPDNSTAAIPPPQPVVGDVEVDGVVTRSFNPVGNAAYNFILMSAYRGGPNSFAIMGLSSKPLHVFGRPVYTCEYQSNNNSSNTNFTTAFTRGAKILPDWGFGRVYTTVVINCMFPPDHPAVVDPAFGGKLLLHASVNGGFDAKLSLTDTILALTESPTSWALTQFTAPPKYDHLYCGSPLYGNLSPQRVREWIAYHVRLFGKRSHFVIYDAGGVHPEVREVLKPWIELGFVTLHEIREQERFDGYYHNQFLVLNDCLHRYRFEAKWMFFFDVDEFIYLPGKNDDLNSVLGSLGNYTQFTMEQMPMSNQICRSEDARTNAKKWGFEKLVYRSVKRVKRDRKYAVQPRNVFATGVHITQNFKGVSTHMTTSLIKFFHYHGTIANRRELCHRLINKTSITLDGEPFVLDNRMKSVANLVKTFELETIGSRLQSTRRQR